MNNEVFIEQLIKRKTSVGGMVARMVICAVLAFVTLVVLFFLLALRTFWAGYLVLFIVLFGYIAYKVWQYTDIEYEYSILNGEITIDRIKGQMKRKNVEVFDLKNSEIVAPLGSARLNQFENRNIPVRDFSSMDKRHKKYVAVAQGKKGMAKIIFEPNEQIVNAMKMIKPSGVFLD